MVNDDRDFTLMTEWEYAAKHAGDKCPRCHGDNLRSTAISVEGTTFFRDVTCGDCDVDFTEHFTLTGYGNVYLPPEKLIPIEPPEEA